MHRDYLTAIKNGESIHAVHQRLVDIEKERHEEAEEELENDHADAMRLLAALNEDPGSFVYQWAHAYLQQAEENEAAKPDEQKRMEARQRKLEEENERLANKCRQLREENERLQRVSYWSRQ